MQRGHASLRRVVLVVSASLILFAATTLAEIISGVPTTGTSAKTAISQLSISKPSTQLGDLMVATIAINGGTAVSVTAPSGWTQITRTDNDINVALISYWKIASTSEPQTYTWTANAVTRMVGGITPYSGVDTSNPIDTSAGNTGFASSASTSPISTSASNEEVIAVFATDSNKVFGTPSGMTQKYNLAHGALGPEIANFDVMQTSQGAVSAKSSNIAGNKSRYWASQTIAVRKQSASIAYVAGSGAWQQNGVGDQTMPVTLSTDANLLLVGVENGNNQGDTVTGVTWNGVSMTLLGKTGSLDGPHPYFTYIYGLMNPAPGSHSVNTQGIRGVGTLFATGYANVNSLPSNIVVDTFNFADPVSSISESIPSATGSWVVGFATQNSNCPNSWTGLTSRIGDGCARSMGDSNGSTAAGSHTYSWGGANGWDWNVILMELIPKT